MTAMGSLLPFAALAHLFQKRLGVERPVIWVRPHDKA